MPTPIPSELLISLTVKELYALVIGIIGYTFLILQAYFRITATLKALVKSLDSHGQDIKDLENKVHALEISDAKKPSRK